MAPTSPDHKGPKHDGKKHGPKHRHEEHHRQGQLAATVIAVSHLK
jgi:hypothetical protein